MNQIDEDEQHANTFEIQDSGTIDDTGPSLIVRLAPSSPLVVRHTRRLINHSSPSPAQTPTQTDSPAQSNSKGKISNWRSDRSSTLLVLELRITKDILVREQAIRQLRAASVVFERLTKELFTVVEAKKAAEMAAAAGAVRMFRARRGSSSSITLLRPDSGSGQSNAAAMVSLKENIVALSTQVDLTKDKILQRLRQVETLIMSIRDATTNIVEGVGEWRSEQELQRKCTNVEPHFRFSWKNGKVPNYLLHLNTNLRELFGSTAIAYSVGIDAEYNPLLLPRVVMDLREADSSQPQYSFTFLTDKVATSGGNCSSGKLPDQMHAFALDRRLYDMLVSVLPKQESSDIVSGEPERWLACLNAIAREYQLEQQDHTRLEQAIARIEHDYNPFQSIMTAGGVDEQFSNLIAAQSPHVEKLRHQLRHRQEDVAEPTEHMTSVSHPDGQYRDTNHPLHVSSRRLQTELQRRRNIREASMQFERRDPYSVQTEDEASRKINRLQGSMLVRKKPARPPFSREDYLASAIQRQYRAYRERGHVLRSLADLVKRVRSSTVDIQRIFRGHRVKLRFRDVLARRNKERRRRLDAAMIIIRLYRRYKRRQRHHQAMTMMAIAQEQLHSVQAAKIHDAENAALAVNAETERLRKLGAERRRYRLAMLEQQKREHIALEIKRMASAITLQSTVRMHLAHKLLCRLREEHKDHVAAVSAITIQSNIRTFLVKQEARRARFRRDLERVNRSATRIQSVYRGYSARSHEVEEEIPIEEEDLHEDELDDWNKKLPLLLQPSTSQSDVAQAKSKITPVVLPPLARLPTSSSGSRRPSRQLPATPTIATASMMRVELKLNQPVFGDDFQDPPSGSSSARGWRARP